MPTRRIILYQHLSLPGFAATVLLAKMHEFSGSELENNTGRVDIFEVVENRKPSLKHS